MLDERSKLDANLRLLIKHPQMHSAIRASWNMGLFFGRLKDFLVDGGLAPTKPDTDTPLT